MSGKSYAHESEIERSLAYRIRVSVRQFLRGKAELNQTVIKGSAGPSAAAAEAAVPFLKSLGYQEIKVHVGDAMADGSYPCVVSWKNTFDQPRTRRFFINAPRVKRRVIKG